MPKTIEVTIPYQPKEKQSKFHLSDAKFRLYIGAWRAGKSYAGCMEAIKQSMLFKGNIGLIGRKDFTDLRDTTIKTFFDICPPEIIRSYNKTEHHLVFKNGSEIYFRELKDRAGLGSLELGWFYIDEAEEVGEDVFIYLKGRLSSPKTKRQCGWLTSNPPNEDHWLYRQFELKETKDSELIHASTYENKDNLPEGYIEGLEAMPPSWRKKYLEGHWGFTPDGTPFYQGYIEAIHKRECKWNPSLPLQCGWDFGHRHPAFVVTQTVKNNWNILMELMGSDIKIDTFAETQVIPLLNTYFPNANVFHYGDPAGNQVNDKSDHTSIQILNKLGIRVNTRPSEYSLRKEIIERHINTMENGLPILAVHPSCRIINDGFLGGYHYPLLKDKQQFLLKHEMPFKDGFYDHLMNALEYVAVNVFKPIARPVYQTKHKAASRPTVNVGFSFGGKR